MSEFRYALMGANGRMGKAFLEIESELACKCVLGIGRKDLSAEEEQLLSGAQALIDFSLPEALPKVLELSRKAQLPLISGVTGYSEEDLATLKKHSESLPVFWAPNMSLGVAVVKKMLSHFSALKAFDFHLNEAHHKNKKDRPSGTAKYLAQELERVSKKDCPITDMRGGAVFGLHEIFAFGEEEEIQITHRAYDRKLFARGALRVARTLYKKPKAFYQMDDLLEELS